MQVKPAVNADPNKVVVMDTNTMPWEPTGHAGVQQKTLERVHDARKGRETAIVKLEAGATLPSETLADRVDIFVLDGSISDGNGSYTKHTFVRCQPGDRFALSSKDGGTIYMKRRNPIRKETSERMVIDAKTAKWTPFPHRGADVLHLYRDQHGIETARFGEVHPKKQLPSHDHAMGEETLIIDGVLKDEYTAYTPGIWFRMPIGVPHAPFTEEGSCKMLIREGDLVW